MSDHPTFVVSYRCVCGQTIEIDARVGGPCEHCGRNCSPKAASASMSMTIGMPEPVVEHEDESDDEMIGRSLDHFTIIDRLGGGGMGAVYRALDESLQRYVAIKVIRRGRRGVNETEHLEQLLQEARAQARVNHLNVVHIYFVSRDRELPYLAMELVPGATLAQQLASGPLPYSSVVDLGLQIARALRESALFDIVHGDIKPSNILLHADCAKLSDFGLSQRMSRQNETDAKISGTPNYMAPEVCRGGLPDTRTDQYSFGVMLFEMTFGRLPYTFSDSTIESRLEAHQHAECEFPAQWPNSVPAAWRTVLERLLAKDPADRFESYDQLIDEVQCHAPEATLSAGRLIRGIAWVTDLLLLAVIQGALAIALVVGLGDLLGRASQLLILAVPVMATLWLRAGGVAPGKRLTQIRVVDEHGLRPSSRAIAFRSVFQLLPIWAIPITSGLAQVSGLDWLGLAFALVAGLWIICDAAAAFFTADIRSLHDRLFKTRVVLDSRRGQQSTFF